MRSLLALPVVAITATLALAGCSAPTPTNNGTVAVVATTNVYGDIVRTIGGSHVSMTSIIDDPSQDPHSFEGDAQVQLALAKANIVIENGGGYDDWAKTLLSGSGNSTATLLNVADISGHDQNPTTGDFNEHLWYDFPTVQKFVDRVVTELSKQDPKDAASFRSAASAFGSSLTKLEAAEASLAKTATGLGAAITEPVPLYMLTSAGFTDVTPPAFSHAIEEGTDVSPSVLKSTLDLFSAHDARVLVYNAQTSGPETDQVVAAAKAANVPVVPVTETMPKNDHYLGWMTANLAAIAAAVTSPAE